MFWQLHQMNMASQSNQQASRARADADRSLYRVAELEAKVEHMALACQAMWELLQERTKLTDEDLMTKIEEIDLRDGRRDGRMSGSAHNCGQCGRKTSGRRKACMYCGALMTPQHPFET